MNLEWILESHFDLSPADCPALSFVFVWWQQNLWQKTDDNNINCMTTTTIVWWRQRLFDAKCKLSDQPSSSSPNPQKSIARYESCHLSWRETAWFYLILFYKYDDDDMKIFWWYDDLNPENYWSAPWKAKFFPYTHTLHICYNHNITMYMLIPSIWLRSEKYAANTWRGSTINRLLLTVEKILISLQLET